MIPGGLCPRPDSGPPRLDGGWQLPELEQEHPAHRVGVIRVTEGQITTLRPYNARYTGDNRSIFRKRHAEIITRVSPGRELARPTVESALLSRNVAWLII